MLYGTSVFWYSYKVVGIYNSDLDPQSKSKLADASLRPTHTIVLFVPYFHAIISAPHRDHHRRTHERTQQTSSKLSPSHVHLTTAA